MSDDIWHLAELEEDGQPVLYRFRALVPPNIEPQTYPELVNICWPYEEPSKGGMPPSSLHERMVAFEERLDSLEGPKTGFLVLSITGNNRKEWVWYVRDRRVFMKQVNRTLAGAPRFPVEVEAARDPDWEKFLTLLAAVSGAEH